VKRVAFVSPLPPAPTGVADYAVEIVQLLRERFTLDLFHGDEDVDRSLLPDGCACRPGAMLPQLHAARPYDLAVYQMGNGPAHAFLYDLVSRIPGLLVLHDLVLHHARARMFLASEAAQAYAREPWSAVRRSAAHEEIGRYQAELDYCYPGIGARLASVHLETTGRLLPYAYPLFRIPVEASRLTLVHNQHMAREVQAEVPTAEVEVVPHHASAVPVTGKETAALRRRLGIAADEIVVGTFGLLSEEKQIETVARAVARAAAHVPCLRLLLVGGIPDPRALRSLLDTLRVAGRTVVAGRVPWEDLPVYMTLPDMVVQLRYPTAGETSGALLRLMAQGRPAIVSDIANQAELSEGTVIRADLTDEEGDVTRAILRLALQPALRARLSGAALAHVAARHAPHATAAGYGAAIERAIELPDPAPGAWPDHWPRPMRP